VVVSAVLYPTLNRPDGEFEWGTQLMSEAEFCIPNHFAKSAKWGTR